MSGIVGSKLNIRGSGPVAKLGTDGQHLLSSGAGKSVSYETVVDTVYDDNKLQANIALLGFKAAVNGSLAKYNLVDQIVDEYVDATGVDASASTDELLASGAYSGGVAGEAPTGGNTSSSGDYYYHYYLIGDTGETFVAGSDVTIELLLVGGGGQGGSGTSGGGAGGGLIYVAAFAVIAGTYTMTIGAGGSGNTDAQGVGDAGSNSVMTDSTRTFTALGGGAGGGFSGGTYHSATTGGGSAAAHAGYNTATTANNTAETPTSPFVAGGGDITTGGVTYSNVAFGNNGGIQYQAANGGAGGGGGAGGVGVTGGAYNVDGADGLGGPGKDIASFNHTLWSGSSDITYAAGGAGSNGTLYARAGGSGIGGNTAGSATGDGTDGLVNTGSGGGGTWNHGAGDGGDGGSGVAVIRYTTDDYTSVTDLTLQSTDTTASTADPNYGDLIILMENANGTATLNTDIKGFISEDSGVTFTEGTLVDEGSWGTNKKIVAFHDLDISAQSGSAMCYKITTHNQVAGSKKTLIHATSIGWR